MGDNGTFLISFSPILNFHSGKVSSRKEKIKSPIFIEFTKCSNQSKNVKRMFSIWWQNFFLIETFSLCFLFCRSEWRPGKTKIAIKLISTVCLVFVARWLAQVDWYFSSCIFIVSQQEKMHNKSENQFQKWKITKILLLMASYTLHILLEDFFTKFDNSFL